MGVDMHVMIEVSHDDEPWRPLKYGPTLHKAPREEAMFALLGDVTNGKGRFTDGWQEPTTLPDGTEIPGWWYKPDYGDHEPIEPICEPRGIPEDASDAWLLHVGQMAAAREKVVTTWFTPDEIVAANWDQDIIRRGILFEKDYLNLAKGLVPERWMAMTGGQGVRIVTEMEYAEGERGEKETFVEATWNAGSIRKNSNDFPGTLATIAQIRPETSRMRLMLMFEA